MAIEKLFPVKVINVRTLNSPGKIKHFKQRKGKRSGYKKAYVTLAPGQDINVVKFQ